MEHSVFLPFSAEQEEDAGRGGKESFLDIVSYKLSNKSLNGRAGKGQSILLDCCKWSDITFKEEEKKGGGGNTLEPARKHLVWALTFLQQSVQQQQDFGRTRGAAWLSAVHKRRAGEGGRGPARQRRGNRLVPQPRGRCRSPAGRTGPGITAGCRSPGWQPRSPAPQRPSCRSLRVSRCLATARAFLPPPRPAPPQGPGADWSARTGNAATLPTQPIGAGAVSPGQQAQGKPAAAALREAGSGCLFPRQAGSLQRASPSSRPLCRRPVPRASSPSRRSASGSPAYSASSPAPSKRPRLQERPFQHRPGGRVPPTPLSSSR